MTKRTAVVAGATGVVGRTLVSHLQSQPGWNVIAVSRRPPENAPRVRHVPMDLSDAQDCGRHASLLSAATHVFYCAFVQDPDPERLVARNSAMLANLVQAVQGSGAPLEHVHLVEGTKWYGSHLGPFTTPAKEGHPRHAGRNFYFDQQDWLDSAQRGNGWTWSAVRPHAVCGFSLGSPMNIALAIAVYGTLCHELGLPFSHPGPAENFSRLYQLTDSGLLARAMTWMATEERCANQAFNVTNGDLIRWSNLWPRLADFFGVEPGPQQQFSLRERFGDKSAVWDSIVAAHALQPLRYESIAGWGFADFVFGSTWDIVSDTGKARRHGFCESVDSEEMLLRLLQEFRSSRVIP
ncbi:MAG: SDR family oxidoreductase [Betaproteobacteria bacterium]|nr:SDR family oxidoreductase [Betaproteobacteria bacterium]